MDFQTTQIGVILIPSREERKMVHTYLEQNYPKIGKSSLQLEKLEFGDKMDTYSICHDCGFKYVLLDQYHHGQMKNNFDEWKSGTCSKCGSFVTWECNSDGLQGFRKVRNNVIAFGPYFREYLPKKHTPGTCTEAEFKAIIAGKKIIYLNPPGKSLNKVRLSEYINQQL